VAILFINHDVSVGVKDKQKLINWIRLVVKGYERKVGDISFVFCSDDWLLSKNREFLNHDFLTDVITFDYSNEKSISGDILISIERIKENSDNLHVPFADELSRVMIHGVLHLLGFADKTKIEKQLMRQAEDVSLKLREQSFVFNIKAKHA
jgi:probable rRNA maturation factor